MEMLKYPVDTASFEIVRKEGYVYVDKTEYLHKIVNAGRFYFLGRPRRFGKSLLLSTLAAYFRGQRHLFQGLAIDTLQPEPWVEYPVLRLDFTGKAYTDETSLTSKLDSLLEEWERQYHLEKIEKPFDDRFREIILRIEDRCSRKVVILVDEYDSPLSSVIENHKLFELYREQLHGFYSVLKATEDHIRFCMLTGVTRFGKVSVFSGLNNLKDLTFSNDYAGICGITKEELHTYFEAGIEILAQEEGWSIEKTYREIKRMYDGYHFSRCMLDIYNPYSVLNALYDRQINGYWCASGIPTLLAKAIRRGDVDIQHLTEHPVSQEKLENLSAYQNDAMALFYQTGYLTLKSYDRQRRRYKVGYPNMEVERGILDNVLSYYVPGAKDVQNTITDLADALKDGKPQLFINIMSAFLSGIPSHLGNYVSKYENYYHTIFYCLTSLLGLDVKAEYNTSEGFIDLLFTTDNYIYLIELKVNGSASDALRQIEEKHYGSPFATDSRQLFLIGLGFSTETRTIATSEIR